jgi:hypothetical protein
MLIRLSRETKIGILLGVSFIVVTGLIMPGHVTQPGLPAERSMEQANPRKDAAKDGEPPKAVRPTLERSDRPPSTADLAHAGFTVVEVRLDASR